MAQNGDKLETGTTPTPSASSMPWHQTAERIAELAKDKQRRSSILDRAADASADVMKGGDPHRFATALESDPEAAQMLEQVRQLSSEEGRIAAMRELGVHVKGDATEKFGITDPVADRLLAESEALRTPEGRARLLSEYTSDAQAALADRVRDKLSPLEERRAAAAELLPSGPKGLRRDGKDRGAMAGIVFAFLTLTGVVIAGVVVLGILVAS
ncbi:hypothetical protein [Microbacterium amylolyticum]|uniref:DUF222 domain-containing protein n=1 Tax=Microbacterium amylolyticum TaxID=936337 RepID=A0ABS4ZFQ2_9MICO|nr:hypothetical protein [Microbacterium amylolyticum]MBP2436105.1 hypothetical protein [Microbacterium amylolyticum]